MVQRQMMLEDLSHSTVDIYKEGIILGSENVRDCAYFVLTKTIN